MVFAFKKRGSLVLLTSEQDVNIIDHLDGGKYRMFETQIAWRSCHDLDITKQEL